jgi:anti-sigma factor ChrR (cupin superfamily)
MSPDRIQELAALHAAGALDGDELREWLGFLSSGDAYAKKESAAFNEAAALLAEGSAIPTQVTQSLKAKILANARGQAHRAAPATEPDFMFLRASETQGWKELPVRGAWIKALSVDRARGYAVLLGKLEPGTHYPAHYHNTAEDIYILTGDLQIGGQTLRAGDFHRAAAGTYHGVNHSDGGCTILAVLSTDHILARFALV